MEFIKSEQAKEYLKLFKPCQPIDLSEKYPGADTRCHQLLAKMLCFNPSDRISAKEAIFD